MLIRTPLRVGTATVWADPVSGTVRYGRPSRTRTLLAGLDPGSYLIAGEPGAIVASAASSEALGFSLEPGASALVSGVVKPGWCAALEATLPDPLTEVSTWLEVGVLAGGASWYCSIPLGRLPWLQARLARQGDQMTYITRIRVDDHDAA